MEYVHMTTVDFGNFVAHVKRCKSPSGPSVYVCLSTCSKPSLLRATCGLSLDWHSNHQCKV